MNFHELKKALEHLKRKVLPVKKLGLHGISSFSALSRGEGYLFLNMIFSRRKSSNEKIAFTTSEDLPSFTDISKATPSLWHSSQGTKF